MVDWCLQLVCAHDGHVLTLSHPDQNKRRQAARKVPELDLPPKSPHLQNNIQIVLQSFWTDLIDVDLYTSSQGVTEFYSYALKQYARWRTAPL